MHINTSFKLEDITF